jgi:hypothetical protein
MPAHILRSPTTLSPEWRPGKRPLPSPRQPELEEAAAPAAAAGGLALLGACQADDRDGEQDDDEQRAGHQAWSKLSG